MMKLYEIPVNSKLRLTLVDGETKSTEVCTYHGIDGMYGRITTPKGDQVYLSASEELVKVGDIYELTEEEK